LNFVNFAAFCGPHSAYSANLIMHTLLPNPLKRALGLGLMLAGCLTASARAEGTATDAGQEITLAAPFGDHAVLQQKTPLPVWGTTLPGAKVTLAFDTQVKTTMADAEGRWRMVLDPMTAVTLASVNEVPKGKKMTVTCEKEGRKIVREINDLVLGDVWLCAGQSNMAGKMRHAPAEKADYPALRQLVAPETGPWLVCTPETVPEFKRVCFFFARRLQSGILVPVGIINAAAGGSSIESWLNQKPFETGGNYTKHIEPLVGFGLRGMIWYQGESNEKDKREYLPKLTSLITGWRRVWNQGDFPVYFVQLPGIGTSSPDNPAGGDGRAEIRQACVDALAIPNTGLAVTIDVGALKEHPPNKLDTGIRLAHAALHHTYGLKAVSVSPLYKSHKIEDRTVRISFHNAPQGLMVAVKEGVLPPKPVPDAKPQWLSLQDKDGSWHWAEGRIEGSDLLVSCEEVKEPVAVRYAYTQHPCGNLLYNKEGMPVSPFTTNGY
jgi:sialate O-acetylesterase